MILNWFDNVWPVISIMTLMSLALSTPAFYFLHKKQKILYWDYGLIVYISILWSSLMCYFRPVFGMFTFGNLFIEGGILVIMCSITQYIKLLLPARLSAKTISVVSISIMIIFTVSLFYACNWN